MFLYLWTFQDVQGKLSENILGTCVARYFPLLLKYELNIVVSIQQCFKFNELDIYVRNFMLSCCVSCLEKKEDLLLALGHVEMREVRCTIQHRWGWS